MESDTPNVESAKHLSELEEGDIVILTLDPGFPLPPINRPAVERTARIAHIFSNSLMVENRRFSISSGKEMMYVGNGWRIDPNSKAFISIPTEEQLQRLPDPEGNYTAAQIRGRREDAIERILDKVKQYLDLEHPEFDQREATLSSLILEENLKETLEWALNSMIARLEEENRDLRERLKQLAELLHGAAILADFHIFKARQAAENPGETDAI
ncbi:hypothetical protein H6F89_30490 [Cyanobacteria bacterium FACHB-63]|nr:hypothetical protein [Cyanobacteria bacterium FACHB-63]